VSGSSQLARLVEARRHRLGEYVTDVYQAGYDAPSLTELSGLIHAAAPLKSLTALQAQIAAEVRRVLAASHAQQARQRLRRRPTACPSGAG
jgi:hypothetical protein